MVKCITVNLITIEGVFEMKNYQAWDRVNEEEIFISIEELEQILKSSGEWTGFFGTKGSNIDKVIYEDISSEDSEEYELLPVAFSYNEVWYTVSDRNSSFLEFELSHNKYGE